MKINSSDAMEDLGRRLAGACPAGSRIYLQGELGAGKTTWVRGFLRGFDYTGNVKSPTYTLVESYRLQDTAIHHLDLYRVNDPDELEAIGLRDYMDGSGICLVEWPERGGSLLADPDILVRIDIIGSGREVALESCTATGARILRQLQPATQQ